MGDPRFHAWLKKLGELHDKKQLDYGREHDPFANVRGAEDFGVPGWVGALIRANDKMRRLQKAAQGGTLANEGVVDSLMDLAVYAVIALMLFGEEQGAVQDADYGSAVSVGPEAPHGTHGHGIDGHSDICTDPHCPWMGGGPF